MKVLPLIMALAGMAFVMPASAQQVAPNRLRAQVVHPQIKNGRPTLIYIVSSNGPMVTYTETKDSQEELQLPSNSFKLLYMLEMPDFVEARAAMENRKYPEARKKFHDLETKYAGTLSVKNSLAARSHVNELECAMKMGDWGGVKDIVSKFPLRNSDLSPKEQNDLDIAKLFSKIVDKEWDTLKTQATSLYSSKKNLTRLQQGRLKYASGLACLGKGEIEQGLDDLAAGINLLHGQDDSLGSACIARSLDGYLRFDDVKKFLENPAVAAVTANRKTNPDVTISDSQMKQRPTNVKEAAALYHLNSVMFPGKALPEKYDGFAVSFKHPALSAQPAAPSEAPASPEAPKAEEPAPEAPKE